MARRRNVSLHTWHLFVVFSLLLLLAGTVVFGPDNISAATLDLGKGVEGPTVSTTQPGADLPSQCGPDSNYTIAVSGGAPTALGALVAGSQGDDATAPIALPFAFNLYGTPYNNLNASTNGNLQFTTSDNAFLNLCLPVATMGDAILAHWDDLRTDQAGGGIYTSLSGPIGSRIFTIQWRAVYFSNANQRADFEVRLHENTGPSGESFFDIFFERVEQGGSSATIGVQSAAGGLDTQFSCNVAGLTFNMLLAFSQRPCVTHTPTVTPTPTCPPGNPTLEDVRIVNFTYNSDPVVIAQGSTVRWTNLDTVDHTSTGPIWNSGNIAPNGQYSFTFNVPGNYPYHCNLHTWMSGTIIVVPPCPTVTVTPTPTCPTSGCTRTPTPTSTCTSTNCTPTRTPTCPTSGCTSTPTPTSTCTSTNCTPTRTPTSCTGTNCTPTRTATPPCPTGGCTHTPTPTATCPTAGCTPTPTATCPQTACSPTPSRTPTCTTANCTPTPTVTPTCQPGTFCGTPTSTRTPCTASQCTPTPTASPTCPTGQHCGTPTPTHTPLIQCTPVLNGHLTWQGIPQPDVRNVQPFTLTLKTGTTEVNYPAQNTDANGVFTLPLSGLLPGPYMWRAKGPKSLANSGQIIFPPDPCIVTLEIGIMRAGDANNDNVVTASDFSIVRGTMGKACGNPGYDGRADFNNDCVINTSDFNLVSANYGRNGAPPVRPAE